jgi:enoyl-CoA hydratase
MGTIRLPRMIGQGRALDMILTGRPVLAEEALRIGLIERMVEPAHALAEAHRLALEISKFPPGALRADRHSVLHQWPLDLDTAMRAEYGGGIGVLSSGESQEGARRFAEGAGRHGS